MTDRCRTQELAERLAEEQLDRTPAWTRPLVRELYLGLQGFEGDEDRRLPFGDADLAKLIVFPHLECLDLTMTSVRDIAPLARMKALRFLCLNETWVEDLSPLAGLPRLKALHLAGTPVHSLAPLKFLPRLQVLDLEETRRLKSLAGLEGARALCRLNLHLSAVEDIGALARHPGLVSLRLHEGIDDLSPLRCLSSLRILQGVGAGCDPDPLRSLRLHALSLTCRAGRLAPLAALSSLRRLSVMIIGTPAREDLHALGSLAGLRQLFLAWRPNDGEWPDTTKAPHPLLPDLEFLKPLRLLKTLDIQGVRIGCPKGLRHLRALEELRLNGTGLANIDELRHLGRLRVLELQDNPLTDLSPLQNLEHLEALNLARTCVHDLSPLRRLRRLVSLVIWGTPARDLAPLKFLTRLEWLHCNPFCRHASALRHARRLNLVISHEGVSACYQGVQDALKAGILHP